MKRPTVNLLLVDDESDVLDGLVRSLRGEPYQISCADSGPAALALLAQTEFAALVTDEQMPGMSGSELLTAVRRQHPHTARILLTGRASVQVAVRCINDAAAARFLEKPCSPELLRAAIAQAIRENGPSGRDQPAPDAGMGGFTREELAPLSRREREVFDLMAAGLRISQIGKRLFVSPHTVRNHVKAIFFKLDLHSQTELLEKATSRG